MPRVFGTDYVDMGLGDAITGGYRLAQQDVALRQNADQFAQRQALDERQFAEQRQNAALQRQAYELEIQQRRRAAQDLLDQEAATQAFYSHAFTPTGPRPSDMAPIVGPYQPGAQPFNGQADPMASMPQAPQGFTPPQGAAAPGVQQPQQQPMGMGGMPGPFQGLDPKVIAKLPPSMRGMVDQFITNRAAVEEKRNRLMTQLNAIPIQNRRYIDPDWFDSAAQYVPEIMADLDNAPPAIRQRGMDEREAKKRAMVELMVTPEMGPDFAGPLQIDEAHRADLLGRSPGEVEVFYGDWQNKRALERKQVLLEREIGALTSAYQAQGADPQTARGMAVAAAHDAPMMRQTGNTLDDDIMRIEYADSAQQLTMALGEAEKAARAYQKVNVDSGGTTLGLAAPDAAEVARSKQEQDPDGLGNKLSDDQYARLRARVAGWQMLEAAQQRVAAAASRKAALVQQLRARMSRPQQTAAPTTASATPDLQAHATHQPSGSLMTSGTLGPDGEEIQDQLGASPSAASNPVATTALSEFARQFPGVKPDRNNPQHVAAMAAITNQLKAPQAAAR